MRSFSKPLIPLNAAKLRIILHPCKDFATFLNIFTRQRVGSKHF